MLKKLKNSLLILCLMIVTTGCVNQNQETHSQQVKLVSTSIAISEILVSLNISKDQVVGIPETQSYSIPKRYQKATKIGTAMSPDMEKLSQLKPDLILSPQSLEGDLAKKYKKLKLNSSFVNLNSLSGMYKSIQELGKLLNH